MLQLTPDAPAFVVGARDKGPKVKAGKSCWSGRYCPQLGWRLAVGGPGEGAAERQLEGEKLYAAGPPDLCVALSYPRLVIFLGRGSSGLLATALLPTFLKPSRSLGMETLPGF